MSLQIQQLDGGKQFRFRVSCDCDPTIKQRLTLNGIPGVGSWQQQYQAGNKEPWVTITPQRDPAAPPWDPIGHYNLEIVIESELLSPFPGNPSTWEENRYEQCCSTALLDPTYFHEFYIYSDSGTNTKFRINERRWNDLVVIFQI